MAAFETLREQFDEIDVAILAASVDDAEKAAEVQGELGFPIAYGVTPEQADSIGSWWEERRSIIQPSEFILNSDGKVVSATYSTGPVGRLQPEDALKMIKFVEAQKQKQ